MQRTAFVTLALCALLLATLPAGAGAAQTCGGKRATIVGTRGDDVLVGKGASDVIAGMGGDDRISGGRNGNDVICGGPGRDRLNGERGNNVLIGGGGRDRLIGNDRGNERLFGGAGADSISGAHGNDTVRGGAGGDRIRGGGGNDRIDGDGGRDRISAGGGNDRVDAGAGSDRASGSNGNDRVAGGAGTDSIFGENGNDRVAGGGGDDFVDGGLGDELARLRGGVFGDGGTDLVTGGTGADLVDGGPGNGDVVRGDQGPDTYKGGPGKRDIASFTTASVVSALGWKSPGCRHTAGFALTVDMGRGIACEFLTPKKILDQRLFGVEDIAGTSYADRIQGDRRRNRIDGAPGNDILSGGGGADRAFGGSGYDRCRGFEATESCPGRASSGRVALVELHRSIDGSQSLVVLGSRGRDQLKLRRSKGGFFVASPGRLNVEGCRRTSGGASCRARSVATILIDARGGRDRIVIAPSVPTGTRITVNGGSGSDLLVGGDGPDHLVAGPSGRDVLKGRDGGDALFGGGGGPDRLFGGGGTDLNTLPATCAAGNYINGGPGRDNASYALSKHGGTWVMSLRSDTAGFTKRRCGVDRLAAVSALEGSKGADILIGDGRRNGMLGHDGADIFRGGGGKDYVDARDDARDRGISCGGGRDTLLRDRSDPRGSGC